MARPLALSVMEEIRAQSALPTFAKNFHLSVRTDAGITLPQYLSADNAVDAGLTHGDAF